MEIKVFPQTLRQITAGKMVVAYLYLSSRIFV